MRRAYAFALAALVLAACGGGGGGGGTTVPGPTSTPTPPPIQTTSVQRGDVNQALSVAGATGNIYTFATVTGSSTARHVMAAARQAMSGWRAGASRTASAQGLLRLSSVVYSSCSNGVESATNEISQSEDQLYERIFYDSACTHLFQDMFIDAVATSASSVTASGTDAYYTSAGQVYDYATLTLTITDTGANSGTLSVHATDAASATAPQTSATGVSCSISSTSIGCGSGAVAHEASLSTDFGDTLAFNASVSSTSSTATVVISGTGSSFSGSLNALSLSAGTFPAWIVTGGTTLDIASFSGSVTFASSGAVASITLTLTDAANDGTVAISASGSPAVITGTVKQTDTGTTLATFTVDASGNGTITYSNGTTAPITNWIVQG